MESRLVPELRFPEFQGEWMEKRLSDLLSFKNGLNASKEKYGCGYKFINVLDIINNDFINHDKIIGSVNVSEDEFQKNIVEYGDILFQRSSETREDVGQANVYLDKKIPATFGGFIIRGKKMADYNPIFLNFLLKSTSSRKEITSKSGGSTRYNVGQGTLSSVSIRTTLIREQTKIAIFLTTVDKRVSFLKEKKKLLRQYKKGLMQKIFSQEIRFKDDNGNDFPDWEENRLGKVCTFFSGGTPKTSNKAYYSGNISFIGSGDISKQEVGVFISKEGFDNSSAKMVEKRDILYALYGATSGEVALSNIRGAINQAVLCIKTKLDNYFLVEVLKYNKSNIVAKYLQGGQGNLSAKMVKEFIFTLPSIPEQTKIASFLSSIDNAIDKLQLKIDNSELYKKGLLQKMFV